MKIIARKIETMGGLVKRAELIRHGCSRDMIDLALMYRDVIEVRSGWYASLDTPADVLRAWRMGGRLACVSAAKHHGIPLPDDGRLHVAVARNAARLPIEAGVVVHWIDTKSLRDVWYDDRAATPLDDAIRCVMSCRHAADARSSLLRTANTAATTGNLSAGSATGVSATDTL
jgi:hypothetical protein